MKIIKFEKLIDTGGFTSTENWKIIKQHILEAIQSVQWPPGSGKLILYDQPGKRRGKGSGVKPFKEMFQFKLKELGWRIEYRLDIAARKRPGPIDAVYPIEDKSLGKVKYFAVEWETGNISSSHRAMNKMAIGILKGLIVGGALVLPTRKMYHYLTDRVGNYLELEPYFPIWKSLSSECKEGVLAVIAVEHDEVSLDVERIPKGTEGRALG